MYGVAKEDLRQSLLPPPSEYVGLQVHRTMPGFYKGIKTTVMSQTDGSSDEAVLDKYEE